MLNHQIHLVIQPADPETSMNLAQLGFESISAIPELMYQTVTDQQINQIALQMVNISESHQNASRFIIIEYDNIFTFNHQDLLLKFLNAKPLSTLTISYKYRWFLERLERRHFFIKYQPIFNLHSKQIVSHECLLRTISDTGECISGKEIFDAAIATKSTQRLDEIARELCIESIGNFRREQPFFINVMPNALLSNPQSIEDNLKDILSWHLQPQQIIFELTELESIKDKPRLAKILKQMQTWGFRIAIDDWCGYVPNNHYFMEFQPDIIKLDRQLVQNCSNHSLKRILIKSLLTSAQELDIMVIAEGLEAAADIECCRDLGVDYGQGFGLGIPQMIPEFICSDCSRYCL